MTDAMKKTQITRDLFHFFKMTREVETAPICGFTPHVPRTTGAENQPRSATWSGRSPVFLYSQEAEVRSQGQISNAGTCPIKYSNPTSAANG